MNYRIGHNHSVILMSVEPMHQIVSKRWNRHLRRADVPRSVTYQSQGFCTTGDDTGSQLTQGLFHRTAQQHKVAEILKG